MGSAQQSAGGKDVLSATGPYGGEYTMSCQIVTQVLHPLFVGSWQVCIGNRVEPYQVDTALQTLHQLDDFAGMDDRIVQSTKADVLE